MKFRNHKTRVLIDVPDSFAAMLGSEWTPESEVKAETPVKPSTRRKTSQTKSKS